MGDSLELPSLFVEGPTDRHTIRHLLARHGIQLDEDLGPVLIKEARNDKGVLDAMATAARASTHRSVGFVVDANGAVAHRWVSVCDRLKDVGLTLPAAPPGSGYIGDSVTFKARVGVWIMPDNTTDAGRLEDLVRTLVPEGDPLFPIAQAATGDSLHSGATFRSQHRTKAELHCWLAWQEEPGRPFGAALKAHYFRHDSEVAILFVAWFKSLFRR
jgi:hypothetical protein